MADSLIHEGVDIFRFNLSIISGLARGNSSVRGGAGRWIEVCESNNIVTILETMEQGVEGVFAAGD